MAPRKYDLGKRAESVEETKRRIIDATFELHNEQGVAATTLPEVAQRADVALGTVYRYFPTIDDLVAGCSGQVMSMLLPPGPEIFAGVEPVAKRVGILVRERFAMYERGARQIEVARCEQGRVAALRVWVRQDALQHVDLVREAMRPVGRRRHIINQAVALTDFYVWRAFANNGVPTQQAAEIIAVAVLATITGASAQKESRP